MIQFLAWSKDEKDWKRIHTSFWRSQSDVFQRPMENEIARRAGFKPRSRPAPPSPPVSWVPGILTKGVRLCLRLDHHGNRGQVCWHLVDLEAGTGKPTGRSLRSQGPFTCTGEFTDMNLNLSIWGVGAVNIVALTWALGCRKKRETAIIK